MAKKLISYNVNGIRAAKRKGFDEWLGSTEADVVVIQETKAQPDQIEEEPFINLGYHCFWHSAEKKGYSGVGILSKEKPKHVEIGCGLDYIDREGRIIRADFADYSVMSVYIPSGSSRDDRQDFKMEFLKDFKNYISTLVKDIPNLIIGGDFNICHTEIDIHNPKSNKDTSGFLPEERTWVNSFLEMGMHDSFRTIYPDLKDQYSWWSYRANARANNKGWRIDYQMVSAALKERISDADILSEAMHSDHCPVQLSLEY